MLERQGRLIVRSRWVPLDAVAGGVEETPAVAELPILAIFGQGGESDGGQLTAALGRVLAGRGEAVVLVAPRRNSSLAGWFGMEALRPGVVRKAAQAGEGLISLVTFNLDAAASEARIQREIVEKLDGLRGDRILFELSQRDGWFMRRMVRPGLHVLVPLAATMGSVISLQAIERFFRDLVDANGRAIVPQYVIEDFDERVSVHRDVRDFLQRRVGGRLLPFGVQSAGGGLVEARERGMEASRRADLTALADWVRAAMPVACKPRARVTAVRWRAL